MSSTAQRQCRVLFAHRNWCRHDNDFSRAKLARQFRCAARARDSEVQGNATHGDVVNS